MAQPDGYFLTPSDRVALREMRRWHDSMRHQGGPLPMRRVLPRGVPVNPRFYNGSTETVPAYGIMAMTGVKQLDDGSMLPAISKPTTSYHRNYMVNRGQAVEAGSVGNYVYTDMLVVAYSSTATPAADELWGPKGGQWTLAKGGTGTQQHADWGVAVAGVVNSTGSLLCGEQVDYGRSRMCLCQAVISTGSTSDALSTVDNVTPMDPGWSPVANSTSPLSVSSGFETDNNAVGVIAWDKENKAWRPLDFPCPT